MRVDANGAVHRHTYEAEFIELHNTDPASVDLSGWHLSDGDGKAFSFLLQTVLPADGRAPYSAAALSLAHLPCQPSAASATA